MYISCENYIKKFEIYTCKFKIKKSKNFDLF